MKKSRIIPKVPKEFFLRPQVPPPAVYQGRIENKLHYQYKIFLGESIRNHFNDILDIEYEYQNLPYFYHARYNKELTYMPDICIKFVDESYKHIYISDIEINGLIHYKTKDQILKTKERKDLIYPYLVKHRESGKEDYEVTASYVVFDVDDFEMNRIDYLIEQWDKTFWNGGIYPRDFDQYLNNMLGLYKR